MSPQRCASLLLFITSGHFSRSYFPPLHGFLCYAPATFHYVQLPLHSFTTSLLHFVSRASFICRLLRVCFLPFGQRALLTVALASLSATADFDSSTASRFMASLRVRHNPRATLHCALAWWGDRNSCMIGLRPLSVSHGFCWLYASPASTSPCDLTHSYGLSD